MLRLNVNRGPVWIDLVPGVRIEVLPMSSEVRMRATQAISLPAEEAGQLDDVGRDLVFMKALARQAIIAWEGVGDADGSPIAPTPENIDALLDLYPIYQAFHRSYVAPGLQLVTEGNGSATSPHGTTAGGKATAARAPGSAPSAQKSSMRRKA